ncbi:hypothetical protein [Dactylosporangium sp. AC04546]
MWQATLPSRRAGVDLGCPVCQVAATFPRRRLAA